MTPEVALLDAIRTNPDDAAPQLVIADWLLAQDDLRGELIVLDHRDRTTPGGLTDIAALERLLFLAAEYTFPCAHDPEPAMLGFIKRVSSSPRYDIEYNGNYYWMLYTDGRLELAVNGWDRTSLGVEHGLVTRDGRTWTADEARTILTILGDAIRVRSSFQLLRFPWGKDPLPVYDGGPLRVYRLPDDAIAAYRLPVNRYGLAARDYARWRNLWDRLRALRVQLRAWPP